MINAVKHRLISIDIMVLANLTVLFLYSLLIFYTDNWDPEDGGAGLGVAIGIFGCVVLHFAALLITWIVSFFTGKKEWAKGVSLNLLVVPVIGFAICLGCASLK